MNWVVDENVDLQIVVGLRERGDSVWYVAEEEPGAGDTRVLEEATRRAALLLTADKDFGDLVHRRNRSQVGVVLLRLAGLSTTRKVRRVLEVVERFEPELPQSFTVVAPGVVRIREVR